MIEFIGETTDIFAITKGVSSLGSQILFSYYLVDHAFKNEKRVIAHGYG